MLVVLIGILSIISSTFVAAVAWIRREIPGGLPLALFGLTIAIRNLIELLIYVVPDPDSKSFLLVIGESFSPLPITFWFLLVVEFTRRSRATPMPIVAILLLAFAFYQLFYWTNHLHGWMYGAPTYKEVWGWTVPHQNIGPARIVQTLWAQLLGLISLIMIMRFIYLETGPQRRQAILILVSFLPIWLALSLYIYDIVALNPAPIALTFMCLILSLAVLRYRLFSLRSIARSTLVEQMSDGIIVLDEKLKVVDVNPRALDILDKSGDESIGKPLDTSISQHLNSACFKTLVTDADRLGTAVDIELTWIPINDSANVNVGSLLVLHDIHHRKQLERARELYTKSIEESRQKLAELDTQKSRFFINLAHEFRNPLTLINGMIESALETDALTTSARDKLATATGNSQQLLSLVNQLMDLSSLEAGALGLTRSDTNLTSLMPQILSSYESMAADAGIQLELINHLAEPVVSLDPARFSQIINNLVANALKFTATGGRVQVVITDDQFRVQIQVRDTGAGIKPDALPHVFDRFYQAKRTDVELSAPGTGIGLALVKELVSLHHGTIQVFSEEGSGTEFRLHIPRSASIADSLNEDSNTSWTTPAPVLANSAGSESIERTGFELQILLVEDNPDMRSYIRSHLDPAYRLIEASDGREALTLARDIIPDLIVSDIMMHKMNGIELCQAIKSDPHTDHIPMIMLSARADFESRLQSWETGADEFLAKPFSVQELNARIENLITARARLRQHYQRFLPSNLAASIKERSDEAGTINQRKFLNQLEEVIGRNWQDSAFTVPTLASDMAMSERQLQRKLRALTGLTPNAVIRRYRLERAAIMIDSGAASITQACFESGFNNLSYFTRCFRQQYGCAPSTTDLHPVS